MQKKSIVVLIIVLILLVILIFISYAFYHYFKSPEKTLGLGANIESSLLSRDGKTAYVKLSGGSLDKNITKIKFIFTDENGNEYNYETTEGAKEIEVPFKRGFWDWLFGRQFIGKFDYQINSENAGLNDFSDINKVGVLFEYKTETGETIETPKLDTERTTNKTTTTGGGSSSGGTGEGGTTPGPSCTKTCLDYTGQCSSSLSDGCSNILDCSNNCNNGFYCYTGEGTKDICISNSITCLDSDGKNYYVKGNVTINSLFKEDFCNGNLTEFYCYYNGTEFVARNESYICVNGCSNGACSLPACTSNETCAYINFTKISTCNNAPDNNPLTFDYAPENISVCIANKCSAITQTLTHTCNKTLCNAECDLLNLCQITECDNLDGCQGNNYYDYRDVSNNCLTNCSCEYKSCTDYTVYNNDGRCVACTPNCTGKECGDDGCGGSCGGCSEGYYCNSTGQCEEIIVQTTNNISQFNITWYFDKEYEFGQFANGDYYVIGDPNITIIMIDPRSIIVGNRTMHGSMIDPVGNFVTGDNRQAFDSFTGSFDSTLRALNVGRPNDNTISAVNPLVIEPNHSLISSISSATAGSSLTDAAVLTILGSAPEPNSFRPGYMGSDKTSKYNVRDLDYSMLQNLEPVGSWVPSLATAERYFERPWLSWQRSLSGTHASNNMPGYGTNCAKRIGDGMLVLNLNYTNAQKKTLMIRLVQLGIDYYSVLANCPRDTWIGAGGAFNTGHKLPVVFAATVLNDPNMINLLGKTGDYLYSDGHGPYPNIPSDYIHVSEDDQTFYVSDEDIYSQPYEMKYTDLPQSGGTKTGNVKVTHDSNVVEGIGTNWSVINLTKNPFFAVKNDIDAYMVVRPTTKVDESCKSDCYWYPDYIIKSIDSNTQLTLNKSYRGNTDQTGNAEYVIARIVWYGHGREKYLYELDEFTNEHLGLPDWGGDHALSPSVAGPHWWMGYRGVAGESYCSITLPALMMDLKGLWNHNALFDYTDRYMDVEAGQQGRAGSDFCEDMWDTYRANYSCVWTRDNQSDQYSKGHYNCSNCLYNCLQSPYCGDGNCNGNETPETCPWDCGTVSSLNPFTKLLNFLKGLLTRETGKAILTGKVITGNAVNETNENENFKVPYIILSLLVVAILIIVIIIVKIKKTGKKD